MIESNFSKLKFLDIFKWLLTGSGIILMISSVLLVLQKEKLMCFSKVGNMDLNVPKRVQNINISTIGDTNNSALYPQADNKNVHDNFKRNINNNNSQEAWQFKL